MGKACRGIAEGGFFVIICLMIVYVVAQAGTLGYITANKLVARYSASCPCGDTCKCDANCCCKAAK